MAGARGDDDDLVRCSFCERRPDQVGKLIAGPCVYICNECIELCNDIVEEEGLEHPQGAMPSAPSLTDDQRRLGEARAALDGRLGRRATVSELGAELGWAERRVTAAERSA